MEEKQYMHCRRQIDHIMEHVAQVMKEVEAEEDCTEILTELSKAKSAVHSLMRELLFIHVDSSLNRMLEQKEADDLQDLECLITRYVK